MGGCAEDQELVNVKMKLAPFRDDDFHDRAWACDFNLNWNVSDVIVLYYPEKVSFSFGLVILDTARKIAICLI